jgi:hypothetical protein
MREFLGKFLLPFLSAGMLLFAVAHVVRTQQTPPKPPPPLEPARTPFNKTVAGAGIVEAPSENIARRHGPAWPGAGGLRTGGGGDNHPGG